MNHSFKTLGYTDDRGGYAGLASWWRTFADYRFFTVAIHGTFGGVYRGVTDDFGNIVKVG